VQQSLQHKLPLRTGWSISPYPKEEICFQQNGAPAHYALNVREYLNDTFPDKWIGRDSVTSPTPFEWPARSPELTTCDNYLWGYMRDIVSKQRYYSNDELKAAVTAAFGTLPPAMLRKCFTEHGVA